MHLGNRCSFAHLTSIGKINDFQEVLCIMWTLATSSYLNWEQLWAEYIRPLHPKEDCVQRKLEMETTLGYPNIGEEDKEENTHKGQVPNCLCYVLCFSCELTFEITESRLTRL